MSKEVQISYSSQVEEQLAKDPELAEAIRDFSACCRQAMLGVETGKYDSFEDAMESITGSRPELIS